MARLSAVEMECNNDGRETRRSSRPTLLRHQHVPLFCSIRDAVDLSGSLRVVLSSHVFLHRQSLKLSSASSRSLDGASTSRNVAFSSAQTRLIWCFGHSNGAPASALQSLLRTTVQNCMERPLARSHFGRILSHAECPRLPFQSPTWNAYPAAWWTVLRFCINERVSSHSYAWTQSSIKLATRRVGFTAPASRPPDGELWATRVIGPPTRDAGWQIRGVSLLD